MEKSFAELKKEDVGKTYTYECSVESIRQTSGPTLFTLFDGTGSITARAFAGVGIRAYPEVKEKDLVKAVVRIEEYEGTIQGMLLGCAKLAENDAKQFFARVENETNKKAEPEDVKFLVSSETLEKLKENIADAARLIRKSILENRQIVIRHHADCDGYTGAVALERAIVPLLVRQHNDENAAWKYFRRAPSRAPFYDISDADRDITHIISSVSKGFKEPLIIVVDNGSGEEDLIALKKLKIYGAKIIIVDHHFTKLGLIDDLVDVHVNPYIVGKDYGVCSGMLAAEIARFVNKDVKNVEFLPAIAGTADKLNSNEYIQYVGIAGKYGYGLNSLKETAEVVDFEAFYLGFIENSGIINDVLGEDIEKQKKLIGLLQPEIKKRKAEQLKIVESMMEIDESGKRVIAHFDADKISYRGEFPPIGKTAGMTFDKLKDSYNSLAVLAISDTFITIRTNIAGFNVNAMIEEAKNKITNGMVTGGGHELAGTVKFVELVKKKVIDFVFQYVKSF